MFYNLLLEQNVGGGKTFSDVDGGSWCAKAVSAMAKLGVITGYPDGRFGPNDSITREEFCAMASRFAKADAAAGPSFSDVAGDRWSYAAISAASAYGWINGFADGSFGPGQPISRAQVVTIVNHMLGRSADRSYVTANVSSLQQFSDLQDSSAWYYYDMAEACNAHGFTVSQTGSEQWSR